MASSTPSQMEAKGNSALAKSVSPSLLQLRKFDVEMERAKRWKGSVPTTVFGGDTSVTPLYHMK